MSKQKARGTSFESSVVKLLKSCGFDSARRVALHGNYDYGDIHIGSPNNPDIVIECKNYKKELSYTEIETFIKQTHDEYLNAIDEDHLLTNNLNTHKALLIVKRYNYNVNDSWLIWKNRYNITIRCRLSDIINEKLLNYSTEQERVEQVIKLLSNT